MSLDGSWVAKVNRTTSGIMGISGRRSLVVLVDLVVLVVPAGVLAVVLIAVFVLVLVSVWVAAGYPDVDKHIGRINYSNSSLCFKEIEIERRRRRSRQKMGGKKQFPCTNSIIITARLGQATI